MGWQWDSIGQSRKIHKLITSLFAGKVDDDLQFSQWTDLFLGRRRLSFVNDNHSCSQNQNHNHHPINQNKIIPMKNTIFTEYTIHIYLSRESMIIPGKSPGADYQFSR